MEEERPQEGQKPPRMYLPNEVQARLEVSASGLRRLAAIYERTVGPLPRNERGRTWPEDAVEALEDARVMVRESRAVSVEAALRGQELGPGVEVHPATQRPTHDDMDPGAAILEELRALRRLVEEQNHRISELEETVRGEDRELEASTEATQTPSTTVDTPGEHSPSTAGQGRGQDQPEPGPWQRVLAWFGFGGPRV